MNKNEMTHSDAYIETRTSEVPVIAMILASMGLWFVLIWLVPMVVLAAVVLMIVLAIVQVAIAPWLISLRLARRDVRCEF